MSRQARPARRVAVGWLAVAAALVLTACRGGGDPQDDFARAVEALRDRPITFTVEVSGDDRPVGVETGGLLATASLHGIRDADGALLVRYDIGADAPLLEIRADPGQRTLLRMGLADLLGIAADADAEAELRPLLDERGISGQGRQALLAGFTGDWIELEDDVSGIGGLTGGPVAGEDDPDGPEGDLLDELVAATEVQATSAEHRFDLRVDMTVVRSALSVALGTPLLGPEVPEVAVGQATTDDDGALEQGRVDLEGDGGAWLTVLVLPAPDDALLPRPQPVARVSNAELAALGELLGTR